MKENKLSSKKDKNTKEHNSTMIGAGIAIGVGVGVAIGTAMDNIGAGIAIGISIGIAIGVSLQHKEPPENDEE
jgi:hypothetical protein